MQYVLKLLCFDILIETFKITYFQAVKNQIITNRILRKMLPYPEHIKMLAHLCLIDEKVVNTGIHSEWFLSLYQSLNLFRNKDCQTSPLGYIKEVFASSQGDFYVLCFLYLLNYILFIPVHSVCFILFLI